MNIWYRHEGKEPEKVDSCAKNEVGYMLSNYRMAFGCAPGQHRYGKDKLWAGRKCDEPKD